jgi:hypothetical protein
MTDITKCIKCQIPQHVNVISESWTCVSCLENQPYIPSKKMQEIKNAEKVHNSNKNKSFQTNLFN